MVEKMAALLEEKLVVQLVWMLVAMTVGKMGSSMVEKLV